MFWQAAAANPAVFVYVVLLGVCLLLMLLRFIKGPTPFDRLTAFESFIMAFLCLVALAAAEGGMAWFFDFILVMSVVGYLSTVALAKFLERGQLGDE